MQHTLEFKTKPTNQPKLKTKKPKPPLDNVIRYYVMEMVPEKSS